MLVELMFILHAFPTLRLDFRLLCESSELMLDTSLFPYNDNEATAMDKQCDTSSGMMNNDPTCLLNLAD